MASGPCFNVSVNRLGAQASSPNTCQPRRPRELMFVVHKPRTQSLRGRFQKQVSRASWKGGQRENKCSLWFPGANGSGPQWDTSLSPAPWEAVSSWRSLSRLAVSLSVSSPPSHLSCSLSLCFRATISVAMATVAQLSRGLGPQPTELASGDCPAASAIGCLEGKQGLGMI